MLITKETMVGLANKNIKWFESKGYNIPRTKNSKYGKLAVKQGTKIKVKVEDLLNDSEALVDVQCDGCREILHKKWDGYKRIVKDNGEYYCARCANAGFKKWISFYDWCYINLSKDNADKLILRWDYELNIDKEGNHLTPKDVSYGSKGINKKGYWFKCLDHLEHISEQKKINSLTSGKQSFIDCFQCNTIVATHPHLIKFLVDEKDAYKYSAHSGKKILMKCPYCGCEKPLLISYLAVKGFSCPKCSDGKSYPEKFMFNVLEQLLDKNFQVQLSKKTLKWCKNYKYDNYINKFNCIIETHGAQHYYKNESGHWYSLEETQENDKNKEDLAKENGIDNYIVIDCRYSKLEWIKINIMKSKLSTLLNFKEEDIDWLKCHEYACKSLVKTTCDLWNSGIKNILEIASKIKISRDTIMVYLKQGAELGWCNYNTKEEDFKNKILLQERLSIKVICLTTGEIFNSQTEAGIKYNIKNSSSISGCCRGKYKSAGKFEGKRLIWMYYDEYLKINNSIQSLPEKEVVYNCINSELRE